MIVWGQKGVAGVVQVKNVSKEMGQDPRMERALPRGDSGQPHSVTRAICRRRVQTVAVLPTVAGVNRVVNVRMAISPAPILPPLARRQIGNGEVNSVSRFLPSRVSALRCLWECMWPLALVPRDLRVSRRAPTRVSSLVLQGIDHRLVNPVSHYVKTGYGK